MPYHIAFWIEAENPFEIRDAMEKLAREMGARVSASDPQEDPYYKFDADDDGQPSEQQEWEDIEGREFYIDTGDD